jgi:hypothetical protein
MAVLQDIVAAIGNGDLKRLSEGNANFDSANSPDLPRLQDMIKNFDPKMLQQIFAKTAEQTNPREYSDHITPGVGGTNPLGELSSGALASVAAILVNQLKQLGGGSKAAESPLDQVPDLRTQDPQEMDAHDVARVARYTQENHPGAFGQAATEIAQKQPAALQSFWGKAALALGAAALASHFIKMDRK